MNDDLRELGITPEDDEMIEETPGEAVDDRVAVGAVGDHETEEEKDGDLSLEEEEALEASKEDDEEDTE